MLSTGLCISGLNASMRSVKDIALTCRDTACLLQVLFGNLSTLQHVPGKMWLASEYCKSLKIKIQLKNLDI